jgi:hypothetical protein
MDDMVGDGLLLCGEVQTVRKRWIVCGRWLEFEINS